MSFAEFYQAGLGLGSAYGDGLNQAEARRLLERQLDTALGAQGAPAAQAPLGQAPTARLPAFTMADGPAGDYMSVLRGKESGGNQFAKNPNSSATGIDQFTASTWAGLARKYPQLGLTPNGRTDPEQSTRAMQAFTNDNARALTAAGVPITPGNLYVSHFLGEAGGPRFIRGAMQEPDAPAAKFVTPGAVAANRSIFLNADGSPKTAREVYAERTSRFGGAQPPAQPRRPPVQVAETEADVQRLEAGMMPAPALPRLASAPAPTPPENPADLPVEGAREAGFRVPQAQPDFRPGSVASPPLSDAAPAAAGQALAPAAVQRLSAAQADNLRAMLRNPLTQGYAAKIIEGLNRPDEFSFQVVGDQLVRTSKSGRAEVVPNIAKPPTFQTFKGSDGNDYILNPQTGQLTRAVEGKDTRFTDLATPEERAAAGVPAGYEGTVQRGPDNEVRYPGKPATSVNIDQKGETAFAQTVSKGLGDRLLKISEEGDTGRTDMALLGQLRALGNGIGTGGAAAIQGFLADKGIKLGDNVGQIEAYGALIDRLTPAQRIPGAGATSDFDARMFKGSLPRLINTPEGNALIVSTLEALAQDRIARALIAERAVTGEMKPADALRELRALPSPNIVLRSGLSELQRGGRLSAEAPRQDPPRSGVISPPSGERSSGSAPPAAAVDYLRQNPAMRDQFDAKYGAGAAERALGGARRTGGIL